MTVGKLGLLAVALAVALLTAYIVNRQLPARSGVQQAPAPVASAPVSMPEVLVAKTALPAGTLIKADQLVWRAWPKEGLNDAYLVKGASSEKDLAGAVVRAHVYAGEPITTSRVVHPGEQGFLAAILEPGKRAVAVPVDAASGVGGFIFPGDFVDVLFTLKRTVAGEGEDTPEARQFSETLITNVRVLAIDQTLENTNGGAKVGKTATLQVSTRQAEKLALALEMGTLSLSLQSLGRVEADLQAAADGPLRIASDAGKVDARSYTSDMDVLFMTGDARGLPPPLALRRKVSVLRGSEAKQARF